MFLRNRRLAFVAFSALAGVLLSSSVIEVRTADGAIRDCLTKNEESLVNSGIPQFKDLCKIRSVQTPTDKPEDPSEKCTLDEVAQNWILNNGEIKIANTQLSLIIKGLGKDENSPWGTGAYAQDKFGADADSAKQNRNTARMDFTKAQADLGALVRKISGSADKNCRTCFLLTDWYYLKEAAYRISLTRKSPKSEDKIGAGKLKQAKVDHSLIVLDQGADIEIIEKARRVSLNGLSLKMMKMPGVASQMGEIIKSLCKTMEHETAFTLEEIKDRRDATQGIQDGFDVLLKYIWTADLVLDGDAMSAIASKKKSGCTANEFISHKPNIEMVCKRAKSLQ